MEAAARTRYRDLVFEPDYLSAVRASGETVRFSRLERTLLVAFTRRPGRLLSREQLLSEISAKPEAASDRNVDFLINRLRRKLRDPARAPRFISTQYGEGYSWIAPAEPLRQGFLVIGPVRGVADGPLAESLTATIEDLRQDLAGRCGVGQEIAFLPQFARAQQGWPVFRFSVAVDVLVDGQMPSGAASCAFSLRDEADGRLLGVQRCPFHEGDGGAQLLDVSKALIAAIWRDLALSPGAELDPAGPPLDVRMQNAALTLTASRDQGWSYIASKLREARATAPDDPELAIMWATYLYARMLHRLDFTPEPEAYRALEDQIEVAVLRALPQVRDHPVLRLAAARLLSLIDRGHEDLVGALLSESLSASTMFAATLSLQGSVQAGAGDLAAAQTSYRQALAYAEVGSEFWLYLQVKRSAVRLAARDWDGAGELLGEIRAHRPAAAGGLRLLYLPDTADPEDPDIARAAAAMGVDAARQLLCYQSYTTARHFKSPTHGVNVMAGPARTLVGRYGRSVLADVHPAVRAVMDEAAASGAGRA